MIRNATMEKEEFEARGKAKAQVNSWCQDEVDDGSLVPVQGIREMPVGVIPDPVEA